jgi:probable F420-dependent oxidoreductase
MRFTLTTAMGDFADWPDMARAAEEAGFHAFSIPDSTFYPQESDSIYPYNDTDAVRGYIEATPFIEPMIAFSWLAGVTKRLHFYPNVMKVPVRSPIILAKLVTSLAVVSGGRFLLGAGIGPWKADFEYNGLDWNKRGKLLDECLIIIKGLMTGEYFEFHGENYDFGPIRMNPVPVAPVPIIVGGHSAPALRRAARLADGWVTVNADDAELKSMMDTIDRHRDEYGTRDRPFQIHVGNFEFRPERQAVRTLADYRRLEALGVTDYCIVPFGSPTVPKQEKLDVIRRFGETVIAPLA